MESFHGLRGHPESRRNLSLYDHGHINNLVNALQTPNPYQPCPRTGLRLGTCLYSSDKLSLRYHTDVAELNLHTFTVLLSQDCKNLSLHVHRDEKTGRITSTIKWYKKHCCCCCCCFVLLLCCCVVCCCMLLCVVVVLCCVVLCSVVFVFVFVFVFLLNC